MQDRQSNSKVVPVGIFLNWIAVVLSSSLSLQPGIVRYAHKVKREKPFRVLFLCPIFPFWFCEKENPVSDSGSEKGQDVFLLYRHDYAGIKNLSSGLRPDTLPTPHESGLKSGSAHRYR